MNHSHGTMKLLRERVSDPRHARVKKHARGAVFRLSLLVQREINEESMKTQLIHRLANNPRVRHLTKGASPRNETKTKIMNLAVKSAAKEMTECL